MLGVVCLAIATAYTHHARTFDGTSFDAGPVGPKTLPTGVGVLFGVFSAYLIIKPDRAPSWPTPRVWRPICLLIISSYFYGQALESMGFIAASAAITILTGLLFHGPTQLLLPLSVAFPVVLAFVFNHWLELRLPEGWWGGF